MFLPIIGDIVGKARGALPKVLCAGTVTGSFLSHGRGSADP